MLFKPNASASSVTSTTSERLPVKFCRNVSDSSSAVALLLPDILSLFCLSLYSTAAVSVTSTKVSTFDNWVGSSKSIKPAFSNATASWVPLSSSPPTPFEAPFLLSSDSLISSPEGASSSPPLFLTSTPFLKSSKLTPVAELAASTSACMDVSKVVGTRPICIGKTSPLGPMPVDRLCPGPRSVGNPPPLGVKAISPLSIEVVCVNPPSGSFATDIAGTVPRIPAVPTGDSMLKLDCLSNFLTSTTRSPNSMSIMVDELLGSPLSSFNLVLLVSNFS